MKNNPIIEKYIEAVRSNIYNLVESEKFIESLRQSIYDYASQMDHLELQDLIDEFGTPEEVAEEYLSNDPGVSPSEVVRSNRKRNIIIGVVAASAILIVCLVIWAMHSPVDIPIIEEAAGIGNNG